MALLMAFLLPRFDAETARGRLRTACFPLMSAPPDGFAVSMLVKISGVSGFPSRRGPLRGRLVLMESKFEKGDG
jgi:hypothetical protein